MIKEKFYRWIVSGLVLIVLAGLIIYGQSGKYKVLGGLGTAYLVPMTATSTVLYPTTGGYLNGASVASSSVILYSNGERHYARCTNMNTNGFVISIMMGSYSTTTPSGIILSPMASTAPSFFEINNTNPFTGNIMGYSAATSTIQCSEN